jgi:crotonobetainyl-CoA:carnitine CoA-transferase CaiB-like acyl-CoA transferase
MLSGIKVVSFNHFLMGPLGMQILGDLGAEVIAIESLDGAFQRKWSPNNTYLGEESLLFAAANRSKKSLALNLRLPEGMSIARKLVAQADVVAENFRPGVMERLGLGYEDIKTINPKIVYASGSGYGPDGPYKDLPGQDLLVQALSGIAAVTGKEPNDARAVGVSAIDHHGGALLALGILAALHGVNRTGEGCRVDVSLLASALDLQTESLTAYLNGKRPTSIRQPGNVSGWCMQGPYGIYPAKDGSIAISLCTNKDLSDALEVLEIANIPDDQNFSKRKDLSELTELGTRKFTISELQERFTRYNIWHMPVNDYENVEKDPQVQHNKHIVTVQSAASGAPMKLLTHPIRYNGKSPQINLVPQPLGAQSREILSGLGYSETELERLINEEVVGTPENIREKRPYEIKRG